MNHFLTRLTVLAATLASVQFVAAETLIFNPTDNSTIRASAANQGTSQVLFAGDTTTAGDFLRSAVAFNLNDPLLAGATINSATVTFTVRGIDTSSADATITLDLHQLTSSFTNDGVTWTSRDGTTPWTTGGGDFGDVLASTAGNPKTAAIGTAFDFTSAALANAAQSSIGGTFNLLLKSASEDNASRNLFQFASTRNIINASPGPKLTIDYTPPGDTTPPELVPPTVPANGDAGVLVTTSLTATFSELIALEDGGTITIDDLGAGPDTVITLPDSQVSVSGSDLVITPASPLATSTDYAIQISNNAVKDLASPANFFTGISDTITWSFQTAADGTAPSLVPPTTPADEATDVATDTNLVAVFDETIMAGSGNIRIRNLSTSRTTVIPVGDPQVLISGSTLTIDPAMDLQTTDDYAIRIDAGAIKDVTGNSFAGILDDVTWNFTMTGGKVLAAFDTKADTSLTSPLDKTNPTDLGIGLVSSGRAFRTYLTFDLSGASAATGDTTLVLFPTGVEKNTSSTPQTFTLFVLGADWDGVAQPGPDGTAVATISFTPQALPPNDDNRGISFTSAALTTAFNAALAGNLHLGIKSDLEGTDARSFLWLGNTDEAGLEPRLNYTVAAGGETFATWIAGKTGVGGQTALGNDPDGDGNDNGVENFFGTEPGVFSAGVVAGTVNSGTGTFTFTHPQGSLASDLTAGYRWSTDLVTFHADGATSGGTTVNFSTVPDPVEAGTPTTVTATVTGNPVQKLFVRVEVTQN